MMRAGLNRWLRTPVLTGGLALTCGAVAVGLPTLVRALIDGQVTGCEFTPYLPFVLVSAILLRWWQASIVAISSVAIMGGLFEGSAAHVLPCFLSSSAVFLASSAMMICIALLLRRVIAALRNSGDDSAGGIVFSLEKGEVWASWYGHAAPVRLGSERRVAEMMQDFLAQVELGQRFADRAR